MAGHLPQYRRVCQASGPSQSRGYDVLAAVLDPQYARNEGVVLEAKRHEEPAYAEAQTLHDKISRLNAPAFWENSALSTQIDSPLSLP